MAMDRSHAIELGRIDWDKVCEGQTTYGVESVVGIGQQHGQGVGSFLRGVRSFLVSPVGREVVDFGKNVAIDVESGERFSKSVPRRARQVVRNLTGIGKKPLQRRIKLTRERKQAQSTKPAKGRPIAISRSRAVSVRSPLFEAL